MQVKREPSVLAEAEPYIGKKVNGKTFVVTKAGVDAAVAKCGLEAVRRFFSNGVDAVVDGKTVSEWMSEGATTT